MILLSENSLFYVRVWTRASAIARFSGQRLKSYFSFEHVAFYRTPLMAASCEGTPKMVRLLLEYGADPSLRDNHKQTAANYALQNQSELYG